MKEKERAFVMGLLVSQAISIIWLVLLCLGFSSSIPGDIEQILVSVLRLDGVLLGFTATLFSFFIARIEAKLTKMASLYVITAFTSFFFSILFGFIGLLNGESGSPIVTLASISFSLTGIFTMIAFFIEFGFEMKWRDKEEISNEQK